MYKSVVLVFVVLFIPVFSFAAQSSITLHDDMCAMPPPPPPGGPPPGGPPPPQSGGGGTPVNPPSVSIHTGDTVAWTNGGLGPHTIIAQNGSFNSGVVAAGGTFSKTFNAAGTYSYYCGIPDQPSDSHTLYGTVTVAAVASCAPEQSQTQTLSCPQGQTGSITQTKKSTCPGPTWGAWTTTSSTCTTSTQQCRPLSPQTQTLSCPSGQTGSITQTRTSSCPGPTWGAWTTTSGTCMTRNTQTSPVTSTENPSTTAELQTLLAKLQAQVAEFERRAGSQSTSPMFPRPPVPITRTLSRGMRGEDVRAVQQFLISQGLLSPGVAIGGFFGPLTERAVKEWQKSHDIISYGTPATTGYGIVGPRTRDAMALVGQSMPIQSQPK